MSVIEQVSALEILDSRGNPTLRAAVRLADGTVGQAAVPSGASTGIREAVELRDGGSRYRGLGVRQAVTHVEEILGPALRGMDARQQAAIDGRLLELDGTENKGKLGANALLGVSLAVASAAANSLGLPLYRYLGGVDARRMPVPFFNILNGGAHADNNLDCQEFMVAPVGAVDFPSALRMGSEVYHALKGILRERQLVTAVGDEGGFAPDLPGDEAALELLVEAIGRAGYTPGQDLAIALDPAASSFYQDGHYRWNGADRSAADMTAVYAAWLDRYPIVSIEDGLAEEDYAGWQELTRLLGGRVQLVGDDLFVTNERLLREGIREGWGNAVLIKVNQIGTLTETLATIALARQAGYGAMISHRSGETEDTTIADLAVATGVGQYKGGAPARGERVAKYNRLLAIASELGTAARYDGRLVFGRGV